MSTLSSLFSALLFVCDWVVRLALHLHTGGSEPLGLNLKLEGVENGKRKKAREGEEARINQDAQVVPRRRSLIETRSRFTAEGRPDAPPTS